MFCAIDTALNMSSATGIKVPAPKPIEFGRTQQEYDDYMKRINSRQSKNNLKQTMQDRAGEMKAPGEQPGQISQQAQAIPRPGQPYDYSNDHIGQLLKDFDPGEPPHEYEEILSDDFFIKASVPGPLNEKMDAMIAKEIQRLFTTIVYLKTQGSAWERYFRDPDEPTGPQGVFPPT